jgi:dTDP-4-dehydrorhamnose 3,5-epimerase
MKIIQTDFKDLLIIEPKVLEDSRGYFLESYNRKTFADRGISIDFVQDNQSSSTKGVLRGLHYQLAPYSESSIW